MEPLQGKRVHVLGIGGRGMAPVAAAAQALGAHVDGCDPSGFASSRVLLRRRGIAVAPSQDPTHCHNIDALVCTALARCDSREVAAAEERGVLHRRMDLLAAVMATRAGVGVTGSHGKGTVVALAAGAAITGGLDPMCIVGTDVPALGGPFREGAGPSIVEVDDSDLAAHFVTPDVAVVTNLDPDHAHLPVTPAEALHAVGGFVTNARRHVILGPSPRRDALARHATAPVWCIGREVRATVISVGSDGVGVRMHGPDGEVDDALVRLIGPKTATNAALAYAAARAIGVDHASAMQGLGHVGRLWRRMESHGCRRGVWVYDDFGGKHPAALRAGLEMLREHHPRSRVVAVFEPVFAATVRKWGWRYARSLALADAVLVLPIVDHPDYPPDLDRSLDHWYRACGRHADGCRDIADAAARAAAVARPDDVIVGFFQNNNNGEEFARAVTAVLDASGEPG